MSNHSSGRADRFCRRYFRLAACLLMLCLALGYHRTDVSAASAYRTGMYQVTATTLNIRSGPGTGYKKLGSLKKGEIYAVSEIRNTQWGKIAYKGKTGWIHLGYTRSYKTTLTVGNRLVAHRGYWSSPENQNSAASYHAAGKAGFWGIEGDLRMDDAGKLVMSHDLPVPKKSCSVETYLDICQQYGAVAVIDLKWGCESKLEDLVELVEKKGMLKTTVFQCSIERYLKIIRDASSDARIWFLCSSDARVAEVPGVVKRVKAEVVNVSKDITRPAAYIKKWNSSCKVCVYTLDTQKLRTQYQGYGAAYVITNVP